MIKQFSENGPMGVLKPCCTTAVDRTRALTGAHPIKPTSPRCHSAWQPNPPADAPLIDAEKLFRQPGPPQPDMRSDIVVRRLLGGQSDRLISLGHLGAT